MASELTNEERETEALVELNNEIRKWNELGVHPQQAIGIDVLRLDSKVHTLLDILEKGEKFDRDELEIRTLKRLTEMFKERREEITPEIQEARRAALGAPKLLVPKDGRLH